MIHPSNSNRLDVDSHNLLIILYNINAQSQKAVSVYFESKQILLLALQSGIGLSPRENRYNWNHPSRLLLLFLTVKV